MSKSTLGFDFRTGFHVTKILDTREDLCQALGLTMTLVARNPDLSDSYLGLGNNFLALGMRDFAILSWEKALASENREFQEEARAMLFKYRPS